MRGHARDIAHASRALSALWMALVSSPLSTLNVNLSEFSPLSKLHRQAGLGTIPGDDHRQTPAGSLDHLTHCSDHQIRLRGLDAVPALGGDHVLGPGHATQPPPKLRYCVFPMMIASASSRFSVPPSGMIA